MSGFLNTSDGERIAWRQRSGSSPGVVFLGGFHSSMDGNKANALDRWCASRNIGFTRFDYFGHGESSGQFEDGTIGRWINDSLCVLDSCTDGPQVLVGSSMGGWLMLHCALERPERVVGLLGIASAPDFTERGIWASLDEDRRAELLRAGHIDRPSAYDESPYRIRRELVEEGRRHLLMDSDIAVRCPVRLVHGQRDVDVPWQWSLELADNILGDDVTLTLIKDGDHRLSGSQELSTVLNLLGQMLDSKNIN